MKVFAVSIAWVKKVEQDKNPEIPGIQIMNTLSVLDAITKSDSIRKAIAVDVDLYEKGYDVHSVTSVEIGLEIRQQILALCSN